MDNRLYLNQFRNRSQIVGVNKRMEYRANDLRLNLSLTNKTIEIAGKKMINASIGSQSSSKNAPVIAK
ncbi:hypothetical protein [Daejeonella sp.]|jgi:hypothetical protein|uniref:hypothetical protein n=1 Tax=Daejeonella sp. TaxID=2805397 RepID=UPI0027B8DC24|nr:hypothetical protein [Daejeonella sp.]